MRWVDRRALTALLIAAAAIAHAQSEYNRVDTFEPGKKYNCIPTADRKGWDCKESGKAPASSTPPSEKPMAAVTPATNSTPAVAATPEKPLPPMATQMTEKPAALPSYLRAAPTSQSATTTAVAPTPPPAPQPTKTEPPQPEVVTPSTTAVVPSPPTAPTPATAPSSSTTIAETSQREIAAKPTEASATPPAPTPIAAPTAVTTSKGTTTTSSIKGNREFLTLPASNYVIELAHAADRTDIDALRDKFQLSRGEFYELHLSREVGDWWILAWGSFDSIAAARIARGELATNAAINAGWPRLIAPLQNEVRRRQEQSIE